MSPQQIQSLQKIGLAVLEAIEESGDTGAPGGVLYAAMMAHGASLSQFQSFMDTLLESGFVTVDDQHCYRLTPAGHVFKSKLQAKFGAPSKAAPATA